MPSYHGYRPYRDPSPRPSVSWEKMVAIGAVLLLVLGGLGYAYDFSKRKNEQPVLAGTYTEGVVDDSPTKTERILSRMTNIGLTYRDADNSIQPALAESWETSPDFKTYTFTIRDGYSAEGLLSIIQNNKTNWTGITITAPEENKLQFALQEPLSLFLSTTTMPLFPYGPYEVVKRDQRETILRPNEHFALGEPYIEKIIIKNYESQEQLAKAAKDGEIQGSADFTESVPKQFTQKDIDLPRYHVLFFNVTRPAFKKVDDRLRVINEKDGAQVNYSLVASDSGIGSDQADALAQKLGPKHISLAIQKKNSIALQKEEILKRDFDMLIYGIDYGVDRDYYPFWHSSQTTGSGLNISGLKDKELDTMLEIARKEQDNSKRQELNAQIEKYLSDKGFQQILSQEKTSFWIDKSIKGVVYSGIDEIPDRFNLVWKWYIKSKKVR